MKKYIKNAKPLLMIQGDDQKYLTESHFRNEWDKLQGKAGGEKEGVILIPVLLIRHRL